MHGLRLRHVVRLHTCDNCLLARVVSDRTHAAGGGVGGLVSWVAVAVIVFLSVAVVSVVASKLVDDAMDLNLLRGVKEGKCKIDLHQRRKMKMMIVRRY